MLDALTLDQLRTFVTVAEAGSFRAGAARLARVQSAVSNAVANLEAALGIALFDRAGHRPVLTPEGAALLATARDILLRVDTLRARARGLVAGVELSLSLVVDTLFPIERVGQALTRMRAAYPAVALRLAVEPLGGPLAALTEGRAQLAILVGEDFRDPRVTLTAIGAVRKVAVVAARHPLARKGRRQALDLPDLADHLQVVQSDPSTLSEGRDFGVLSPQTCRVASQDSKHALIRAGLGWGRLPLWLVEADLAAGRLVRLRTKTLGRNSEVVSEAYLAQRLDVPLGPAAQAFVAALA